MKSLLKLARKPGDVVSLIEYGKLWNAVVDHVIMRRAEISADPSNIALLHPWKVTLDELEPENNIAYWGILVRPGWVNDEAAGVIVKTKEKEEFVKLQDEPQLIVRAELDHKAEWKEMGDGMKAPVFKGWKNVDNLARPRFFRTEEMWQQDLYETQLFAINKNNRWECEVGYSAKIARLENATNRIPRFEFCRLYLARDSDTGEMTLHAQNRVFWNVGAGARKKPDVILTPPPVVGFAGVPPTYSFAGLFEDFVEDVLNQQAAGDEFGGLIEGNIAAQSDYNTIQIWTC